MLRLPLDPNTRVLLLFFFSVAFQILISISMYFLAWNPSYFHDCFSCNSTYNRFTILLGFQQLTYSKEAQTTNGQKHFRYEIPINELFIIKCAHHRIFSRNTNFPLGHCASLYTITLLPRGSNYHQIIGCKHTCHLTYWDRNDMAATMQIPNLEWFSCMIIISFSSKFLLNLLPRVQIKRWQQ